MEQEKQVKHGYIGTYSDDIVTVGWFAQCYAKDSQAGLVGDYKRATVGVDHAGSPYDPALEMALGAHHPHIALAGCGTVGKGACPGKHQGFRSLARNGIGDHWDPAFYLRTDSSRILHVWTTGCQHGMAGG